MNHRQITAPESIWGPGYNLGIRIRVKHRVRVALSPSFSSGSICMLLVLQWLSDACVS